jgi:primase-polymerase (primpol)-like protein
MLMRLRRESDGRTAQGIPTELRDRDQWVVWREVDRDGRRDKLPFQPDGQLAKSNDSSTWASYDAAAAVSEKYSGLGYVFSPDAQADRRTHDPQCVGLGGL